MARGIVVAKRVPPEKYERLIRLIPPGGTMADVLDRAIDEMLARIDAAEENPT